MQPYRLGIHYNSDIGGQAFINGTPKSGNSGSPNSFAVEFHFQLSSGSRSNNQYLLSQTNNNIILNPAGDRVTITGSSTDFPIPTIEDGAYVRLRLEKDLVGGAVTGEIDVGDGNGIVPIDTNGYTSGLPNTLNDFAAFDTWVNFSLLRIEQDFGSGFQVLANVDPSRVSNGAGGFVDRGEVGAEAGSENRIYDTIDGSYFEITNVDLADTFPPVYDIVSVNGERADSAIYLGSTGNQVTMSNAIDPDAVTLGDGNKTYEFLISTDGTTTTFDLPLESDDTVPNLGDNLTLSVIKGPYVFTKNVSLRAPAGHTVRKLVDPIELHESTYSYGMGFAPMAGDHYFWLANDDFDITQNNEFGPSGAPPWQYAIWHLSGAGLRKTNVVDGYGAINANPFMNAGPDQLNVAAGSTVILDASASYDTDGNIVSYEWLQTAGDDVVIDNVAAAITEFVAPSVSYNQTLSFKVTGTDEEGATGEATVNIGVLPVPIIPTISVAAVPNSVMLNDSIPVEATVTDAVSVAWTADLSGAFVDATASSTNFDATGAGSLTLTCTATSSTGHTASASVTLTVIDPANIPAPELTIAPIESVMGGRSFTPSVTVVDNFGEGVTYAWSANSGITIDDAALERPSFTVPIVAVDTPAQISCTVTDANGKSTMATIDVLLIPYVITIDDIDTLHFELVSDNNIQAIKGMLNREIFSIKITDEPSKIPPGLVNDDSLLFLDHEIFSHIEIWTGSGDNFKSISSNAGEPIGIRLKHRVEAHALMGKLTPELTLSGDRSSFDLTFVAFLEGYTEGLVLTASEQKPTTTGNIFKVFKPAPAA